MAEIEVFAVFGTKELTFLCIGRYFLISCSMTLSISCYCK